MTTEKRKKITEIGYIGNGLGFAGGVAYSMMKGKSFWKGFGISILFGLIGHAVFITPAYFLVKDKEADKETDKKEDKQTSK